MTYDLFVTGGFTGKKDYTVRAKSNVTGKEYVIEKNLSYQEAVDKINLVNYVLSKSKEVLNIK